MTMDPDNAIGAAAQGGKSCCGSCGSRTEDIFYPGTLHKYVYAQDNPVNRIDPSGRDDVAEAASLYRYVLVYTAATVLYYAHQVAKHLDEECTLLWGSSDPAYPGLICHYSCPHLGHRCTYEPTATTCRFDVEEWETTECP